MPRPGNRPKDYLIGDLVNDVAEIAGLSKYKAKHVILLVGHLMKKAALRKEKIQITGFGSFTLKDRPETWGVCNLPGYEGIPIQRRAKTLIEFHPYEELMWMVNEGYQGPEVRRRVPRPPPWVRALIKAGKPIPATYNPALYPKTPSTPTTPPPEDANED